MSSPFCLVNRLNSSHLMHLPILPPSNLVHTTYPLHTSDPLDTLSSCCFRVQLFQLVAETHRVAIIRQEARPALALLIERLVQQVNISGEPEWAAKDDEQSEQHPSKRGREEVDWRHLVWSIWQRAECLDPLHHQ